MSRLLTVVAIAATVILAGILYELRRIDESLLWLSGPIKSTAAAIQREKANPAPVETEEERKARIQREIERAGKDFEYAISAPVRKSPNSGPVPRAAPRSAPAR